MAELGQVHYDWRLYGVTSLANNTKAGTYTHAHLCLLEFRLRRFDGVRLKIDLMVQTPDPGRGNGKAVWDNSEVHETRLTMECGIHAKLAYCA